MKKSLCAIFLVLLLFTGCSINTSQKDLCVPQTFSNSVTITHRQIEYNATLTENENSVCISYDFPKSLQGLSVTKDESGCKAEFLGLKVNAGENYFIKTSSLSILYNVLSYVNANKESLTVKRVGETVVFSGYAEELQFEIKTDKNAKCITEISVPSEDLKVIFN